MKTINRPPAWILLCLALVSFVTLINLTRSGTNSYSAPLITIISNVDGAIRRDFAAKGQAIEIKIDVTSHPLKRETTAPVRPVPVWQHSYQEKKASPSLRDKINSAITAASPPHIRLKNLPYEENKIPKIVHQMWKDTNIPDNTKDWIKKWSETNPDWTYMFWTDESARNFVSSYYPMLLERYDGYAYPVQKADMFRYILLFAMGGVYADIDIEPLKSLNAVRDWAPCVLSTEPDAHAHVTARLATPVTNDTLACNALMACRPGHPYIFFLISELLKNWEDRSKMRKFRKTKNKCPLEETLGCTGPYIASVTLAFYQRSYGDLLKKFPTENVIAADPQYFLPTFAEHAIPGLKTNCNNKKIKLSDKGKKVCEALTKNGFKNFDIPPESMTNHHWYDSYHFKGKRVTAPLKSVLPNAILFPNIDFELVMSNKTELFAKT